MSKPEAPRRTLFHGPFGAEQSRHARDAVCAAADAGARDILHVVANRAAALAVRSELVNRRKAVFGLRVITLKELPREIERRARIKGVAIAGGVVDELLLERAIRTATATATAKATSSVVATGLAPPAAQTITEIERGDGTLSSFEAALNAIHERGDGTTILLETWRELERLRGSDSRSQAVAQRAAIQLLEARDSSVMNGCSLIVLEDLPLFGPLDRDMMKALVTIANCPIVATCEYAAHIETSPAVRAYNLLCSIAQWDAQPLHRDDDPLDGAGERIFAVTVAGPGSRKPLLQITRLEAAGEAAEVRLAARVVLRHLRGSTASRPMRGSDIMIVARGSRYRELIQEVFTDAGIGVNSGVRLSASGTSLGSVLLDLLQMAADVSGGTREQALRILRSPHLDLGTRAADRLMRRVRTLGYLGVDGWDKRVFHALGKRTRRRVVRFRRSLGAAREAFAAASSNKEMAFAVRKLAKELRLVGNAYFARKRASADASGSALETRLMNAGIRDDNQTWERIEQVLDDTMPDILKADASGGSDAHLSFAERWITLFYRALDDETLQRTVSGNDLVRVAGTSAGNGQPARVTIILGLRQQAFPRQARQDPFLRDTLRTRLVDFGIELVGSEDTADREREAFIRAITTASEALYLSYAATDAKGKAAVASFFIEDLQRAIGKGHHFDVERLGVADVVPRPEDAASRSEMLAAVAHGIWQRLPATPASVADRRASFSAWNELLTNSVSVVPVSSGRMVELRPSFSAGALQFSPHHTLELSASQLKTIQHCTYEHFVNKVLRPGDLAVPEYDALSKGTLVHEAMMQWVRLGGWSRGDAALGELDGWFANRAANLPPSAREGKLARHMIDEDRGWLNAFVRKELDVINAPGAARPAYNELAFGQRIAVHGERDPASIAATFDLSVQTSMGPRVVKFTGSIDRVDTYQRDQTTCGIALDYKTGATSKYYSDAMHDGTDLQLRLYLLALERLWGIMPVGALYVGFGDSVRRGAISEVAEDRIGEFDRKFVTVMKHDVWDNFVHSGAEQLIQRLIERLVTFDIVAQPDSNGCGFCELGPICRYTPNSKAFADA